TKTDLAHPYRILLAMTDDDDAKLVSAMLATVKSVLTCKITRVTRAEDAIAVQSQEPQDVAIADLHLPDAPGLPGLDLLRRETQGLPLIVYAYSYGECTASRAAQRGAHDLLVRGGFDPYLLVRAVRYAAERRRSRDALRQHQEKLTGFQSALLDLAKHPNTDADENLRRLCEASSTVLGVERVGIWL